MNCWPILDIQLSLPLSAGIKSVSYFIDFLMWVLETEHGPLCLHGYLPNPGSNFLLRGMHMELDTESPSQSTKLPLIYKVFFINTASQPKLCYVVV